MVSATACETGFVDLSPDALEEQIGFPTAFLSASAATVLASFWAVNDFSTWLLMDNFYQRLLRRGDNAALALQQSGRYLRSMTWEQVITHLDAERLSIEVIRRDADAASDDETYIAATLALDVIEAERKRMIRLPTGTHPFHHAYYWAAFAVHGAIISPVPDHV